jgi:acetyltransferase-like isoleucine patch superfamily enzyme
MLNKKVRDIRVKIGAGLHYYHCGDVTFSRKPETSVEVGSKSYSADVVFLYTSEKTPIKIGSYTSIGRGVTLMLAGGHNPDGISNFPMSPRNFSVGGVKIGSDVWIGDEVTIMGGVEIGDGAVVGAKSLVPKGKKLDPFGIYAGIPAKLIRYRFDKAKIKKLEVLKWWDLGPDVLDENRELFYTHFNAAYKKLMALKKSGKR